jgi:hypothetical protein
VSGLFPSGFPYKIFYAFLISSMRITFSSHLMLLDLITLTTFGRGAQVMKFFIMQSPLPLSPS